MEFGLVFLLALLLSSSAAQEANTDGFFVKDFLLRMGGEVPTASGGASPFVCSWRGVSCDGRGERVLRLSAPGFGLAGEIPENTIGKLAMLEHLDLSMNNITGFSSDFWGLGGSLKTLNLSRNQISGSLPNNIVNFGRLEALDLSENQISGELPATLSSLSAVKILSLRGNQLEGEIPGSILGCNALSAVDLSSNRLSGRLPAGLPSLRNLTALNLSMNRISGRLANFSAMPALSFLNLSGNLLQGPVHGVFGGSLRSLDLSRNQFQGRVSFNWSTLEFLDLSENRLSGEFDLHRLGEARSLSHLNLAANRFSRESFPELRNLPKLRYLNLSAVGLEGSVGAGVARLPGLTVLDLSRNHLSGRVPDLRSAADLTVVDLSMNNLTGELPSALLLRLPSLQSFNFSFNNLTLCDAQFPLQRYKSSFLGCSHDGCPFAADPKSVPRKPRRRLGLKLMVAVAVAVAGAAAATAALALLCLAMGRRNRPPKPVSVKEDSAVSGPFSFQTDSTTWVADVGPAVSVPLVIFEKPLLNFTFADLLAATCNFDRGTLLAEGRFGPVYRGFLPGGLHVAVKVLARTATRSDDGAAARELDRLGRIRHPNLVPLAGYCIAGDQRIAIYDYMDNGNLQNLLHDLPLGLPATEDWSNDTWDEDKDGAQSITSEGQTTWRFRHRIALGVARALAFLHHGCIPQIVHMDVKASSVYLDAGFEPRLADFGLARLVGGEVEAEIARGSPGYAPPERAGGAATAKSDVYGFGVVLFELVTGKKPLGDEYGDGPGGLVGWVRGLVKANQGAVAVDPKLRETGPAAHMEEALRIGYLCTADSPAKRPSMQQIVGLLKDIEPVPDP
ncbi:leucine-rich repeat protein kinase family protein [Wolffia australiana]